MNLDGKVVLVTGGARRIGQHISTYLARAGADIIIHYQRSQDDALQTQRVIESLGRRAWLFKANLEDPGEVEGMMEKVFQFAPVFALINNAAIFENISFSETTLNLWQRHMNLNLTAPFLLTRDFFLLSSEKSTGRVINIIDWRALRPGMDHFPYTISKAALASLTFASAQAVAPRFSVNAVALGAILPPVDDHVDDSILVQVPQKRWAHLDEVGELVLFLLTGPSYITGEVIHLDGGRHLV